MMKIRHETTDDQMGVQVVESAATATLRQTYRPNRKAIENKARINRHLRRLVADIDGVIAGTVSYYTENQSLHIIGLGVHPDFRRQGVARELIRFLEEIARTEGYTRLHLHTVRQTGNVDIFERLGFDVIAEREDDFSESDTCQQLIDVEMEKRLISEIPP